jgi:hypothetical protein
VEFVVRSMKETGWIGFSLGATLGPLSNMGQELFEPPSVAGWALGQTWFSTGAMLTRMNFASALASNQKFKLAAAMSGARNSPQALVDGLLARLTPADLPRDAFSDLVSYAGAGAPWTASDAQLQTKAAGLAHLILGSAEYQLI